MSSSASGASPALPAVSQEREQSFVTTSSNGESLASSPASQNRKLNHNINLHNCPVSI